MSDQIRVGIEGMNAAIATKLAEVEALKLSVNLMCRQIDEEPLYPDADTASAGIGTPVRADQFYGKGLQPAVREYLERAKRAASTEEIVKALEQGGYDFAEQGWAKAHRPRILAISLVKNAATFRRLPNGMFGLESWYEPRVRKTKTGETASTSARKPRKTVRKKRSSGKNKATKREPRQPKPTAETTSRKAKEKATTDDAPVGRKKGALETPPDSR